MRPRIFITQPVARSAIERLRRVASVKVNPDSSRIIPKKTLVAAVRKSDILFSLLHDRIDRDVIAANPKLRAVASQSITPDNIDVAEATRRKIPVTVVPPIVAEATADINFGLMLMVARRMVEGDRLVHKRRFPGSQSSHLAGAAVYGKTIGLVGGGGRIGSAVARRARGFGMRVLYWAPRRKPENVERELAMTYAPLDQLLKESDFVSLHSPLRPETRHQIGGRELALMKSTAFLINTARGAIVDEAALARALKKRQIAGAGLDVFEHEPNVTPALLQMANVVTTPHLGSAVVEVREQMAELGIAVTYVPDYCMHEVSDHAMALLLALARKIPLSNKLVQGGRWEMPAVVPIHRLAGRVLGLVGFGNIPRALAPKAKAFGLRVVAHDPYVSQHAVTAAGVESVSFDRLLEISDFVSMHAPLLPTTRGLFNAQVFQKMKKSACLINTARGPLVDEDALVSALDAGHLAAAALDVVAVEPLSKESRLIGRDNVVLTPHTAFYSVEALNELQTKCAADVARVLSGEAPVYPVKVA